MPIVLFFFSAAMVFYSWDLQKTKAGRRFLTLRDEGVAAYLDREDGRKWFEKNQIVDRIGAIFIGAAVISEIVIRLR